MANEKRKAKYNIVIPVSRTEMRLIVKDNPNDVDSYTRRNLIHNFFVIKGEDITRNFRR